MHPFDSYRDYSLLLLRLVVGSIFIYAGTAKLFIWEAPMEGMGPFMIYLTMLLSIAEPIGGAALILGFWVRRAAACLAIIMTGSLYFVWQFGLSVFTGMQGVGMDYNLLILAGCTALMTFGGGKWGVDAKWRLA